MYGLFRSLGHTVLLSVHEYSVMLDFAKFTVFLCVKI